MVSLSITAAIAFSGLSQLPEGGQLASALNTAFATLGSALAQTGMIFVSGNFS